MAITRFESLLYPDVFAGLGRRRYSTNNQRSKSKSSSLLVQ